MPDDSALVLRKDAPMEIVEGHVGLGPLAAALAKAQGEFGDVKRGKKVKVQLKSGGSYEFAYAPLDQILAVIRAPLAKNGLALVQLLDSDALVTMLIHDSGASLEARTPVPSSSDIQGYGSAITYLRRYAIQAMLGIAAEDDDDGNRAAGNQTETGETKTSGTETLELLGKVDVRGKAAPGGSERYKGDWRETPDGAAIGFALRRNGDKDIPQVLVIGDIADALRVAEPEFMGADVHVKGRLYAVKVPGRTTYNRLVVGEADGHFIETPDVRIPALPEDAVPLAPGQEVLPLDDEERALVGGAS